MHCHQTTCNFLNVSLTLRTEPGTRALAHNWLQLFIICMSFQWTSPLISPGYCSGPQICLVTIIDLTNPCIVGGFLKFHTCWSEMWICGTLLHNGVHFRAGSVVYSIGTVTLSLANLLSFSSNFIFSLEDPNLLSISHGPLVLGTIIPFQSHRPLI